jgi:5,10-methylenetetrahydrofolate reductase
MKNILDGKFVITGELEPVKTTSLEEVLEGARILKDYVVAINITDNPTAFAYMNALVPSYMIQKEVDVEAVYQMVVRDRNRLALVSDLLAAGALGIKNVLAITGDHVSVGDNPQAKPVFDLDSSTFVYMIRKMVDEGLDMNKNKIEGSPKFNIGIAANINADPLEPEILKVERKAELGADFVQTQAVYDVDIAKNFMEEMAHIDIPVLIGMAPFKSMGMMEWMIKYVPGILVPKELQERLVKANEKGGKQLLRESAIDIFGEMIKELRKTTKCAGIHMMAIGFEWIVPKIIERSRSS